MASKSQKKKDRRGHKQETISKADEARVEKRKGEER